ncbi:head GIN domain-containing protein [Oceanirhabdus sp. W0125-5]|uniref:head GIN domain-containing protein n=1 Tax=Oceanirhabdus sp. W0125-5 TaxID=2999116 RepID=UPI0022F3307F|nr:head GIN domain-containing protein [Oceanirhabdus sp. W0125-5]WBW98387.1 DUF2807 domain-containing protein [Oceanirhabdus sp. W0125-5]
MKKIISIMLILLISLTGCTVNGVGLESKKGSGIKETKTFDLKGFKKISASHVFQVTIEKSDEFYVEVTYDDNLAEDIKVEVKGDTLKLYMDKKFNYNNVEVKATIKMPDIYGIKGSGVCDFELEEGFDFDHDLNLDFSGVSKLRGKISTGNIEIDISGCSSVSLKGSGKELSCDVSGVSDLDLENFIVDNADVEVSGSSTAEINTNGKIKVDASGTSTLKYKGDATIDSLDVSGVAKVKKIK